MNRNHSLVLAALGCSLSLGSLSALAQYIELDLTGFQPRMGRYVDPNLNGWGMAAAPDGPYCVANTATGTATFYDASGKPLPPVITVPAAPTQPNGPVGSPTGVVYNPTSEFVISANGKSAPARFLFDTLDGLICGWNPEVDPTHAIVVEDNSTEKPFAASYTALALTQNSRGQYILYAADSGLSPTASNNRFDMFDGSFRSAGSFTDPNVATEYPGNTALGLEYEDGVLYGTFAGFVPPFGGVVDIFDTDGNLLTPHHFAANSGEALGPLVNPFGIARAPANFGHFSSALLIGNIENGKINAFDSAGTLLGELTRPDGSPIIIPGLWDITFGGDSRANGKSNQLYFTAGVNFDVFYGNGLFGMIFAPGPQGASKIGNK